MFKKMKIEDLSMKDGCILSDKHYCTKYSNVLCSGYISEKLSCPVWGEVFATEKYYEEKLSYDSMHYDDIQSIIKTYYKQKV
jgi:hypothetical protein